MTISTGKIQYESRSASVNFKTYIESIGSNNRTIRIKGELTANTSFAIPSNVEITVSKRGKLTIGDGVTVTFNGPVNSNGLSWIDSYIDSPPIFNNRTSINADEFIDSDINKLKSAVASAIASGIKDVYISSLTIDSDYTVPTSINLHISGVITLTGTAVFTVEKGYDWGIRQIFSCSPTSKVIINQTDFIRPEWFGAKGDGITDDIDAFEKALGYIGNDAYFINHVVKVSAASYIISKPIILWNGVSLIGDGIGQSLISMTSPSATTGISGNTPVRDNPRDVNCAVAIFSRDISYTYFNQIKNIKIKGPSASSSEQSSAVRLDYVVYAPEVSHMTIERARLDEAFFGFFSYNTWMCTLTDVSCLNATKCGFGILDDGSGKGGSTSTIFTRCWVNTSTVGYFLFGLNYSSLINCGADHIKMYVLDAVFANKSTPYWFKLSFLDAQSCGCEDLDGHHVFFCESGSILLSEPQMTGFNGDVTGRTIYMIYAPNCDLTLIGGNFNYIGFDKTDATEVYCLFSQGSTNKITIIGDLISSVKDVNSATIFPLLTNTKGGIQLDGDQIVYRSLASKVLTNVDVDDLTARTRMSGTLTTTATSGSNVDLSLGSEYNLIDAVAQINEESDGVILNKNVRVAFIYGSPNNKARIWITKADGTTDTGTYSIRITYYYVRL